MSKTPFDPIMLLEQYYLPHTTAHNILLQHSTAVANKAVEIATRLLHSNNSDDSLDLDFIRQAALLHDIGIFATDAPALGCYGSKPYLCHGIIGHDLLLSLGLMRHASVCQNHIGVGLSSAEIIRHKLPLPAQDFIPQNLAEQIITYADLFFSKNPARLNREKTAAQVRRTVISYGEEKGEIFDRWHTRFSPSQ